MAGERSSRESGGTGNAGAGAGRGGKDVGGQRDKDGNNRDFKGNLDKGKYGGAHSKAGQTYGTGATRTNSMGISVSRTPQAQQNLMGAVNDYNDISIGERLAGILNFGQFNPAVDPSYNAATMNVPNTSWDAVKSALDVGGMVAGLPLGSIYGAGQAVYSGITGEQPTFGKFNVGPIGNTAQPGFGSLPNGQSVSGPAETSSGGGLFGGGDTPSNPQDNRGAGGGLLQPTTQPGVTPLAPVAPAAQPAAQQAKERQKRMYALNGVNIPGPTPYSFTGAKWL